jgi:serine/threonine protein phosphatase PrpC
VRITSCGITDVGMKRQRNEDNYLINDELRLFVVADGMGGHAGGEYASQIAVTTVEEVLSNIRDERHFEDNGRATRDMLLQEKLKYAIRLAGKRIYERAQEDTEFRGMGTTALVLYITDDAGYVAHVGDSRCYRARADTVEQLTEDHSLVNEQIKAGLINRDAAKSHKLRNIITRSLGYQEEVEIDTQVLTLERGDLYMLCSDGLSNLVEDNELLDMVHQNSFQEAARKLVDLANRRGGDDNITCVIARVDAVD